MLIKDNGLRPISKSHLKYILGQSGYWLAAWSPSKFHTGEACLWTAMTSVFESCFQQVYPEDLKEEIGLTLK